MGIGNPPTWDRKMKWEDVEPEEWEEVSNRRAWTLGMDFISPHLAGC